MNKYYFLIFSIFLYSHVFAQRQNVDDIKVKYKVRINRHALQEDSKNPQVNARWERILSTIPSLEFSLRANKEFYKFEKTDVLDSDFYAAQKSALMTVAGNRIYYKNPEIKLVNETFIGQKYNIPLRKKLNWTITRETKNILGFSCIKAVSNFTTFDPDEKEILINVEAWFAPEINIYAGPFGMDNLPGLVLEAYEDERFSYYATKIDFSPTINKTWKVKPGADKTVEQEEYDEIIKKVLRDIRARG